MESRFVGGSFDAPKRLRRAAIEDIRAGRDFLAASSSDREWLLAELRVRRERVKELIRRLDGRAGLEERPGLAVCYTSRRRRQA
jgi:hypothetical protein